VVGPRLTGDVTEAAYSLWCGKVNHIEDIGAFQKVRVWEAVSTASALVSDFRCRVAHSGSCYES
jgi:hypothetical protein